MKRVRRVGPTPLYNGEATHIWAQAIPGAVVVQMKRDRPDERRAGHPVRHTFVELSISEAVEHHRLLGEALAQANAMGWKTPGGDSAPPL